MTITKHTITGQKGQTVYYTIANIAFQDGELSWDTFPFYTPHGPQVDAEGHHYFTVPADSIPLTREEIDKRFYLKITAAATELIEAYQEEPITPPLSIGLEGDIIATGHIPAAPEHPITIHYKEVI